MTVIDTIANIYLSQPFVKRYLVPFLGCAIVYFLFRKRREFGLHALQNTAASVLIFWVNLGFIFVFFDEISGGLQRVYAMLNIPTVDPALWAGVPLWLVCVIGVVVNDFVYYWCHRLMHTPWGWPTHAAHHSDTHVNAFTAYRIHFLEWLLMTCSYFFLLTWLQIPQAIPLVILFTSLHGVYVHMDLPFTHGRLRYLLSSPAYHRWHHADVPQAYGKNLANIIPLWDVLFGTHYTFDVVPDEVEMGALKSGVEDKNPLAICVYPVLEWTRLVRARLAPAETGANNRPSHDIPAE
jgi:sterol desaturase/sphingolipid hydroxylase (fatty acid hydroxylase superfamily)